MPVSVVLGVGDNLAVGIVGIDDDIVEVLVGTRADVHLFDPG